MPRPKPGLDPEVDEILKKMDGIKAEINQYLKDIRKKFNCDKIVYACNRKYRYQLEVPMEHIK